MASKVIEAQLRLTATENLTKTFDNITKQVKASTDSLKQTAQFDAIVARIKPVEQAMQATAKASAAMAAEVTKDTAAIARETTRLSSAINLSEPLRRDLQAMQLNRREIAALARDATKMHADQERALSAIGNSKVREQIMRSDQGQIETRLRAQAQGLAAQRAAEEAFAKQIGAVSKAQLAEQIRTAKEKARVAREAEREATREASEGARERARIARQEANAEIQAARETARALRSARRDEARAARGQHTFEHRAGHVGRGVLAGAGAAYGAHQVGHYGREIVAKGGEYEREQARGYLAGLTPEEQKHANLRAMELQQQFPSINRVQVLEHLRSLRGTFGDMHHAEAALPDILKSQVVLGSLRGNDRAAHDLDQVVKGLEGAGLAANPEKFNTMLDSFLKASSLFGDTISGEGFREYIQNSKSSKYGLSESYLAGVVPTMMQHDGAGQFGTMQRMAFSALIGDRQTKKATAAQQQFGVRDKKGKLLDQEQFVSDPYQWAVDHIMPEMKKRNIDLQGMGREKGAILLTRLFSNANAGEFFASLLMNQTVVEKDRQNLKLAKGREAATGLRTIDPNTSLEGLSQAVSTFAQTLSNPLVKSAPEYMNALTDGLNKLSGWMDQHPQEVKTGTGVVAGVAAVTLPSIVGHTMKALAGQGTGVLANSLRIGGAGLTGIGSLALNPITLGGTALGTAGYFNAERLLKEHGAAGLDPATGTTLESNPMDGLGPSTPWLKDWWQKTMPTMIGGAPEETGKTIGEGIGRGIVNAPLPPRRPAMLDDFQTKADETGTTAGKSLLQRLMEAVSAGIEIPIRFTPGEGAGMGLNGGSGVQKASFGGGGGLGGLIRRASFGDGATRGGTAGGGSGLSGIGGGIPRLGGGGGAGSGNYDGGYTGNDGRRAARGRMSAAGAENVGSWMEFFRRPVDQGGMGYTEEQARGQIAMMQGESGLNLDPTSRGDHNRAGVPQSFGTVQWNRAAGRFGKLQALAQGMGKDWTDRGVQQEMYRREMMGAYRGAYERIRRARTGEQSLGAGISDYENPKHHDLAYAIRKPFLDRLRRGGGLNGPKAADAAALEPRLVKGLDGVEGLDLGNGTMRMPNGAIRSIPRAPLPVSPENILPVAPTTGGGGASGTSDLREHIAELGRHVDRFGQSSMHAQLEVTGLHRAGMRATAVRIRSAGGLTADMGISSPDAKEDGYLA